MTSPSRWLKIKSAVGAALELAPEHRKAFVDQACGDDPVVRDEVNSLLSAYSHAEALSSSPVNGTIIDALQFTQYIGNYRLRQKLGEGGMGQVWLAEQTSPVRRQVAIKLIGAGMLHPVVLQRFQSERQSLAIMEHPAIAKVFDAGTTPNGQPYFVMEYVEGLPITRYCDEKKLPVRQRLELFIQVCEGVQHAHQKAIIHRDLKPANILVIELDGKPRPRIIDFGLAKNILPTVPGETLFTQAGVFLGTPGYTSPEQTDPSIQDVDTRTDVYSLGVILYELFTGSLPFDTEKLKKQPLDELLKSLREVDPPSPSTKVSRDAQASAGNAESRGTQSRDLATQLRGDLDCITLTALEKDRERRYASPAELAADIRRYLENKAVSARPATAAYRLRKYARRHLVSVSVAAGIAALLLAFVITQTLQLRRITRERDRANRITEFMTRMFQVSDPSEARGNTITAREILDKTSRDMGSGLDRDLELKAQMLHIMGKVYQSLGLYSRAESLLKQALDIRKQVLGPKHPDTLDSAERTAWAMFQQGNFADAERLERELLLTERNTLGPENRLTLATMNDLSSILDASGHIAEAEDLCQKAFQAQQRLFGPEDPDTLRSSREYVWILRTQGHLSEAEKFARQGVDIRKRVAGPENSETLLATSELGLLLEDEGHHSEAEQLLRDTLKVQKHILGSDHENTITTMDDLAITLQREGRLEDAEVLYKEAIEASRRTLGPEHRLTLLIMSNLATIYDARKEYAQAETQMRQVLEIQLRILGNDHRDTALSFYNMGENLRNQHRYPESIAMFQKAFDIQRKILGSSNFDTLDSEYNLASALALDKKPDKALLFLSDAIQNGFSDSLQIEKDLGWNSLRQTAQFEAILAELKKRAAVQSVK